MIDRPQLEQLARQAAGQGGRYRNRYPTPHHGLADLLRWQWQSRGQFPKRRRFPVRRPDPSLLASPADQPRLTWIGHASFLFQYAQESILTDPVFSLRCSPLSFIGPKRVVPPALGVAELPTITRVLISHNHYDHLDDATVRQLQQRFGEQLCWYVPQGLAAWLRRRGVQRIVELGWWQSHTDAGLEAFCLPTQHFSGRGARDANRTLWCSWWLQFSDFGFYFAGDTGYAPLFKEIGQVLGSPDLALLPIGAYQPRWFMAPVHINPAEAVQIHCDLGARQSVAMHWGTFILTDEPLDEPPQALAQARQEQGLAAADFQVPEHGETLTFSVPRGPVNG